MASSADDFKPFARASLLLIGLAWTLPFLQPNHRYPLTSFYSEWLAFALGLAAALLLLRRECWRETALPVVALAPVGLAAVIGLQAALGRVPYPEQALTAALYLSWAALLIVLGHHLGRALTLAGAATVLAWFLLCGGVANAIVGLLQHFLFSTPLDFLVARKAALQVHGNLGQPNHYAAYLSLSLVSAAYLYCCGRLHVALTVVCAALFLLLLALSGSRSPWLYLAAFALLSLLLRRARGDAGSRRLAVTALCLLPGFAVAHGLAALPLLAPSGEGVTSAERLFQMAGGIAPRLQLWSEAWNLFLTAPLLGAGFGQFAWHHFLAVAASGASAAPGVYNHAHNLVFHLLAETGLVGALIITGAIVMWLVDLRRVRFEREHVWLLALIAVIGTHSLLEYPLWYSYFLGMAALLLGLGAGRAFPLRSGGAARLVAGAAVAIGCFNLVAVVAPYRQFERLFFLPEPEALRPVDDAAFAPVIAALYREPLIVPYVELALAYGARVEREELTASLALTGRAVRFAPVPVIAYRHALLLALAGEPEAARAQFERALRAYPAEARDVVSQLGMLARRWPAAVTPLLESAAATGAIPRAANP